VAVLVLAFQDTEEVELLDLNLLEHDTDEALEEQLEVDADRALAVVSSLLSWFPNCISNSRQLDHQLFELVIHLLFKKLL
jgi:hypothetical protein